MSNETLPKFIDPKKLADKNHSLNGSLKLELFKRLSECLVETSGAVDVELNFSKDDECRQIIQGVASTSAQVRCQRCLEPMEVSIQAEICLAVVRDEQRAKQLPRRYDPLIIDTEEPIGLVELIEDELLLSFSEFEMHEDEQCNKNSQYYMSVSKNDLADQENEERTQNPFSILANLKLDQ